MTAHSPSSLKPDDHVRCVLGRTIVFGRVWAVDGDYVRVQVEDDGTLEVDLTRWRVEVLEASAAQTDTTEPTPLPEWERQLVEPHVEAGPLLKVDKVMTVAAVRVALSPDNASRLYSDIYRVLEQLDINVAAQRDKLDVPVLYGLYDNLYQAGVA